MVRFRKPKTGDESAGGAQGAASAGGVQGAEGASAQGATSAPSAPSAAGTAAAAPAAPAPEASGASSPSSSPAPAGGAPAAPSATSTAASPARRRQVKVGRVVSNKMQKTVIVSVENTTTHRLYHRYMKKTSKFAAHDAENRCQVGDVVEIVSSRPLSRTKRWRVHEVLKRAE
jgi:small subunit ribosomal protein S17